MKYEAIPVKQRFYAKVLIPNDNGCMLWTGCKDSWGYGHLHIKKTMVKAHRLSYKMHNGKIPEGLKVLHKCDTPACVAPEHLFLGTDLDNTNDCINKGRFKKAQKGEEHSNSKLTDEVVLDIRKRLANGELQSDIARFYGVSHSAIYYVKTNRTWSHVK